MLQIRLFISLILMVGLGFSPIVRAESIDGIVAVVNSEIITLSDLRIAGAFGLLSGGSRAILEKKIDMKLVLQMTKENITLGSDELDDSLGQIMEKLGNRALLGKLEEFDLELKDLKDVLKEQLEYEKILSLKFSRGVFVNLQEIESYYNQSYVPQQKTEGKELRPMMEILDELESAIKIEKTSRQIEVWLRNLRQEAEIQIYTEKYPDYFNKPRLFTS